MNTLKTVLGEKLKTAILDPHHVMGVLRCDEETKKALEELEKLEINLATKNSIAISLTELATILRVKYKYSFDVELAGNALYHLSRGLNLYPCTAVAYYMPEIHPIIFLIDDYIAVAIAPRVE